MPTQRLYADVEKTLSAPGRFFRLVSCSGTIKVTFTRSGGSDGDTRMILGQGMAFESGLGWDKIVFHSDTEQDIEFVALQEGKLYDDSFIPGAGASLQTIQGTVTYGASSMVTLLAGVATKIADAASGRKQIAIYNTSSSQTLFLHNSNLTTFSAIAIAPGGILLLNSTQEWWGYNDGGSDVEVWKSEIT